MAATPTDAPFGYVTFGDTNQADAMVFTLRSDGTVSDGNPSFRWVAEDGFDEVVQMTDAYYAMYSNDGFYYLYCSIGNGDSTFPGATGLLTCTMEGQSSVVLQYCPSRGNYLAQADTLQTDSSCSAANLAAIPIC